MRVTNAGILGNAYFDKGLSFDPSFEFPRGSGHEGLGHAELWVGGELEDGATRVSGGPILEWRPTLVRSDIVLGARAGGSGSLWGNDDDADGRVDEDPLNGRDDDGDGRIDEDFGLVADQELVSTYRDDENAAVNFAYESGEAHVPMHLAVLQEAFAWALPGLDHVAGYQFTVRNDGMQTLRNVRLGVLADLDSRRNSEGAGHLNDRIQTVVSRIVVSEGRSVINFDFVKDCFTVLGDSVPCVTDGMASSGLPAVAVVGLSHTTDPLGFVVNDAFPGAAAARASANAPRRDSTFRTWVFARDLTPGQGGLPVLDMDRYLAMSGQYPEANRDRAHDWVVLLSCGPFARLRPGGTLQFALAFVIAASPESLSAAVLSAKLLWRGTRYNFAMDDGAGTFDVGATGANGHEVCFEPPPDVRFDYDPHCPSKFFSDPAYIPLPRGANPEAIHTTQVTYQPGSCIWTDFDCDACTGLDGKETQVHWQVGGLLPPKPTLEVIAADTSVVLLWDNLPEIVIDQPGGWLSGYEFGGYRVYRLDDWKRTSLLPAFERWQQLAQFRPPRLNFAGRPLDLLIDIQVRPDTVIYGQEHFPPGRYRLVDHGLADGFDYLYIVTTVFTRLTYLNGAPILDELESPLTASFPDRVTPRISASATHQRIRVVPNPYRGSAPWERPPIAGDPFTRHIDFIGLPRTRTTLRIYTLSGDLVQVISHDGSDGNGQAQWNLITRNGQDIQSGIYLFSAQWPTGHEVGRFVVIR